MRKITKDAAEAFMNAIPFKRGNTLVEVAHTGKVGLYLFNNLIATLYNGELEITTCGMVGNQVRDLLNAIPDVNLKIVRGKWCLEGRTWEGEWVVLANDRIKIPPIKV